MIDKKYKCDKMTCPFPGEIPFEDWESARLYYGANFIRHLKPPRKITRWFCRFDAERL